VPQPLRHRVPQLRGGEAAINALYWNALLREVFVAVCIFSLGGLRFPFALKGKVVTARAIKACIGGVAIQLQTCHISKNFVKLQLYIN
jgi:hypothetical protein